ncbi:MFS transporter [Erythrobacter sp.]|uniref:MFS transporter n=1 Tax=Erythrobacter sp. TaxID=1042 RepID=UPI001425EA84|nr:MFS transporter [Erythrobacter sp.]QIQ86580.1 MAG: MFS transporter [Erythrobacter sp.]
MSDAATSPALLAESAPAPGAPAPPAERSEAPPLPSLARAWSVAGILSLAAIVSYIDRQVLNLLVEPIKADLGLTDVEISVLQGFSFALLYAVLAIPLAWVADRSNRKWVILGGLVCWSGATFMSGFAAGFAVLFIARMLIGIGEATLSPAGFSMIADCFEKARLPAALSVFTGSGFIGSGLALVIGGALYASLEAAGPMTLPFGTFEPWQLTFFAIAALSVPLFVLILLFVREPARQPDTLAPPPEDNPSAFEILTFLKAHAAVYLPLFFGFSSFAAAQFGIGAWAPSFFIRTHGWTQLEVGQALGPVVMATGPLGVVAGGFLAERLLLRGVRDATLKLSMGAIACALPFALAFPLVEGGALSLALLAAVLAFGTVPFGAGVATFPLITPNRMRAQVIAVYLLVANLLGYSAGPILVAWLTDGVFADPAAIDLSLAIAAPAVMAAGLAFIAAALGPYRALLDAAQTAET